MPEPNDLKDLLKELASQPPVIDPTANVLKLVEEAVRRLDDLNDAEARHVRELMNLRAVHSRELAAAEKERLDAIRSIDAQAIQLASSQVTAVANGLETKINTLAETMRQQLASTATLLDGRISSVERNQYQGQGAKQQQGENRAGTQWAIGAGLGALSLGITVAGVVIALAVR